MNRGRICIFAKAPLPGQVKTRLVGDTLTAAQAAALAGAFLADTLAAVARLDWAEAVVAWAGAGTCAPASRLSCWPQGAGDLGARMERVLARALSDAPWAIALGTDSPGLPTALLTAARDALSDCDAVLGPSEDGGFYLLGLTRCPPGLLANLPWSRADTAARTEAQLSAHGLRVTRLPTWYDVDVPADLLRLMSDLLSGAVVAPATCALLRALGLLAPGRAPSARGD